MKRFILNILIYLNRIKLVYFKNLIQRLKIKILNLKNVKNEFL